MTFRYALQGKLFRGPIAFSAASRVLEDISGAGVGGGLSPNDYSVVGLPLVQAQDTVTIATAADNEDYTVVIRGRPYTIDSGGGATVTTIRDALRAAVDADPPPGITTADVGADAFTVTSDDPGVALDTEVDADTPANITLALGMADNSGNTPVGVAAKRSAQLDVRATAAITATFEIAIVG